MNRWSHSIACVLAMVTLGASCASLPDDRPSDPLNPTLNAQPKRLSDDCRGLLQDLPTILKREPLEPVEDVDAEDIMQATHIAKQCVERGELSEGDLIVLFRAARRIILAWYEANPATRGDGLNGDEVFNRATWADHYRYAVDQIRKVDENEAKPVDLGEIMLRVDVLASELRRELNQVLQRDPQPATSPRATPMEVDPQTAVHAQELAVLVLEEARAWKALPSAMGEREKWAYLAPARHRLRDKEIEKPVPVIVRARIERLSRYYWDMSRLWGTRSNDSLRRWVGEPYYALVDEFSTDDLPPDGNRAWLNENIEVTWIAPAIEHEDDENGKTLRLGEIRKALGLYDRKNLRALGEMWLTIAEWRTILDTKDRLTPEQKSRIDAAMLHLKSAVDHTDDEATRLRHLARLVNLLELPTVETQFVEGNTAERNAWHCAGKDFAIELLCMMNEASLESDPKYALGRACDFMGEIPSVCGARTIAIGLPPDLSSAAVRAYEALIGTLYTTTGGGDGTCGPAKASGSGTAAASSATEAADEGRAKAIMRCEMQALAHAKALLSLEPAPVPTSLLLRFVHEHRVSLPEETIVHVMQHVVEKFRARQQRICESDGRSATCMPDDIKEPKRRIEYCEGVETMANGIGDAGIRPGHSNFMGPADPKSVLAKRKVLIEAGERCAKFTNDAEKKKEGKPGNGGGDKGKDKPSNTGRKRGEENGGPRAGSPPLPTVKEKTGKPQSPAPAPSTTKSGNPRPPSPPSPSVPALKKLPTKKAAN